MTDLVWNAPWPDEPFLLDLDRLDDAQVQDLSDVATRPVLAVGVVSGPCEGIRLAGALSVHLLVASPDARFGRPGVWTDLVARRTAAICGRRVATYVATSGRLVDAQCARTWGLVTRIADDPSQVAAELVSAVGERSPLAVRTILQQAQRGSTTDYILTRMTAPGREVGM